MTSVSAKKRPKKPPSDARRRDKRMLDGDIGLVDNPPAPKAPASVRGDRDSLAELYRRMIYMRLMGFQWHQVARRLGCSNAREAESLSHLDQPLWNDTYEKELRRFASQNIAEEVFRFDLKLVRAGSRVLDTYAKGDPQRAADSDEAPAKDDFKDMTANEMNVLRLASKSTGDLKKFIEQLFGQRLDVNVAITEEAKADDELIRNVKSMVTAFTNAATGAAARGGVAGAGRTALPGNGDGDESPEIVEGEYEVEGEDSP